MEKKNITIHDIARQLGISASTVSRALSDHPRISQATRTLVKETAIKLGYHPNSIAAHLRKGKSKTAGILVPRITRVFFANVIGGIEEVLSEAGYSITICQSYEEYSKELQSLNTLNNLRVDGIIISLSAGTTSTQHLQSLQNRGLNIVMFDRIAEDMNVSSVKIDDFYGAYQAVSHLLDQGYTRIAHFSGPQQLNVYRDRQAGYLKALKDRNIRINQNFIIDDCLTKEKGIEASRNLLKLTEKPDAFFAASDFSAVGVMITAKSMGVKIPSELGLVGFANEPFTEFTSPSLSSVDQDSVNMGKIVARVFLNSLEPSFDPKRKEKIVLTPELIIRESSSRKKVSK
jgi:LacI family transcriptional regulator